MKPDEAPPNTPNPTEPDAETIELDDSAVNDPAVVVRDIMTRGVVTLGMDRSVSEAKELFEEHGLHHLVVMERGVVAGIVSDRDVLRWISPFVGKMSEQPRDLNRLEHRVHQIMSRGVITIEPDASLEMAAARLIRHRVGCLPVTLPDGGRLVGIVTWRDLVRWMAEHHGMDLSDRGQTAPSKGAPKTDAA
ncbi:MAG: CBS domain-containing protein [Planctomycetota bacterium]